MRYIVLSIAFLIFNFGLVAQQMDVDSIAFTDSLPVEIIYQKSIQGSQINLGRNHFLSFPGSFDDPSRLLMKYPGISTQNDQANFIIYDGMPPHYTKWTIYDTDIINPNHLSNAGTLSDRNSRASGGVNSFSGQILGNFSFNAQPGMGGDLLTHAGSANMKPRTPFENKLFFNVSAIGLEAGIERKLNESGTSNLLLNYRYSFTGLLGQMGVDFGGEVIGFQDAFAKVELDNTLGGKLSLFGLYGASYNDHAPQDSAMVFKDGMDIRYDAKLGIIGANYLSNSGKLSTSLVYSTRVDERVSFKPASFLPSLDIGNLNSRFEESRLSLHSKYRLNDKIKFGIKVSSFSYDPDSKLDEELSIVDDLSYVDIYPYMRANLINNEKFNVDLSVGAYYESLFGQVSILPALGVEYSIAERWSLGIDYNLTSQMQTPELYQVSSRLLGVGGKNDLARSLAHHLRIGVSDQELSFSLFYHKFNSLVSPDGRFVLGETEVFTDLSNLDIIPNTKLSNEGKADIAGVSLGYDKQFSNGLSFNSNASFFSSTSNYLFRGSEVTFDNPYSFGQVVNFRILKRFKLSKWKFINLSTSIHYRGPALESEINTERSREIGRTVYLDNTMAFDISQRAYHRVDLRISYVKKKSNKSKYKSVISLDIQNLYGRENDAYHYYDPLTDRVELQKQLGMLPVISYRLEF